MKKAPLIETNPYLKDPALRKRLILLNAVSSTAIEGVRLDAAQIGKVLTSRRRAKSA